RWGWDVAKVALVVVALIALPGMLFPELMLTPFLKEESTRALGSFPLRLVCITLPLDAVSMVLLNALLGAGENTKVMFASVGLQWGLFLPAAFVVGPILGFGLTAVWIANIVYRQIQLGLFGVWWQGDGWTRVQV
ncbi:MAG: MATE family efflux transporter, partial [Myxococcota bacterium]